jgi:hypothetical protein
MASGISTRANSTGFTASSTLSFISYVFSWGPVLATAAITVRAQEVIPAVCGGVVANLASSFFKDLAQSRITVSSTFFAVSNAFSWGPIMATAAIARGAPVIPTVCGGVVASLTTSFFKDLAQSRITVSSALFAVSNTFYWGPIMATAAMVGGAPVIPAVCGGAVADLASSFFKDLAQSRITVSSTFFSVSNTLSWGPIAATAAGAGGAQVIPAVCGAVAASLASIFLKNLAQKSVSNIEDLRNSLVTESLPLHKAIEDLDREILDFYYQNSSLPLELQAFYNLMRASRAKIQAALRAKSVNFFQQMGGFYEEMTDLHQAMANIHEQMEAPNNWIASCFQESVIVGLQLASLWTEIAKLERSLPSRRRLDREALPDNRYFYSMAPDEMAQYPKTNLLELLFLIDFLNYFPKIKYVDSLGNDGGGLTRDFITKLFEALCNESSRYSLLMKSENDRLIPQLKNAASISRAEQLEELRSYQAIGAIFAFALQDYQSIRIGTHFHEVLFQMIHVLTESEIDSLPLDLDEFLHLDRILKPIYHKLLIIYLRTQYPHTFGFPDITDSEINEAINQFVENGKIPQALQELYEGQDVPDIKADFLKDYQINNTIAATLVIAKSMRYYSKKDPWDIIKTDSPATLEKQIQGSFHKQEILAALRWDAEHEVTQKFLKDWVDAATDAQLERFLCAMTGSSTLSSNRQLYIHLFDNKSFLPTFSVCTFTMNLPKNYPNYAVFKEKLEKSLAHAEGFQFQ